MTETAPLNKQAFNEQFARVAKALAHPKRVEILDLLSQSERPVDALAAATGLPVTTASSQLHVLRAAHIVDTRREGNRVYYRLAGDDVAQLIAAIHAVARNHIPEVARAGREHFEPDGDEPEPMSRGELLERARRGDVVVLDVRPAVEYEAGHIEGAVSIPLDQLAQRLNELPADVGVVAYCRGPYCLMAPEAVRLLRRRGRHARRLVDGMPEWRLAGLPTATSPTEPPLAR